MPVRFISFRSDREIGLAGRLLRDAVILLGVALAIIALKSVSAGAADHPGPLAPPSRSGASHGPAVETGSHAAVPPVMPEPGRVLGSLTAQVTDPAGTIGIVVGPETGSTAASSGAVADSVSPTVDRIVPSVVAGAAPVAPLLAPVSDAIAPLLDPVLGAVGPATGPIVPGPPVVDPGDDRPTPGAAPSSSTGSAVPTDDASSNHEAIRALLALTHADRHAAEPTISEDPALPFDGSGSGFGANPDPDRDLPSGPLLPQSGNPTGHPSHPPGSPCVRDLPADQTVTVAVITGAGASCAARGTLLVSLTPSMSTASAGTPPFSPD